MELIWLRLVMYSAELEDCCENMAASCFLFLGREMVEELRRTFSAETLGACQRAASAPRCPAAGLIDICISAFLSTQYSEHLPGLFQAAMDDAAIGLVQCLSLLQGSHQAIPAVDCRGCAMRLEVLAHAYSIDVIAVAAEQFTPLAVQQLNCLQGFGFICQKLIEAVEAALLQMLSFSL